MSVHYAGEEYEGIVFKAAKGFPPAGRVDTNAAGRKIRYQRDPIV